MKIEHAEEYTQSLGQIVTGSWRQIAWAREQGIPKALGMTTEQWVKERLGGYVRMTIEERREAVKELSQPDENGDTLSTREIGQIVGASHTQVRRDIDGTNVPRDDEESMICDSGAGTNVPPESSDDPKAKRDAREEKREARRQENKEKIEKVESPVELLGSARFATIVIDPPWDWGDEEDNNQLGRAKPDYHTMPIHEIQQLPVMQLSDKDCHIYLWVTNRSLPKGFLLLETWGFRYITCLTWVKPNYGMGNYFRGQTEQILFGVRGQQPLKRKDQGTVFEAPRGKGGHSSKPEAFYGLVESCSPGPYLEMFSRDNRDGWTHWGESSNE